MEIISHNFSRTIEVQADKIRETGKFNDIFDQIKANVQKDELRQMGVREVLKAEQHNYGMVDMLDLIPNLDLFTFITEIEKTKGNPELGKLVDGLESAVAHGKLPEYMQLLKNDLTRTEEHSNEQITLKHFIFKLEEAVEYERVPEFIQEQKKIARAKPAPLVKLYMHFGYNDEEQPYGVHGFILPPTCSTPPHNHRGDARHEMNGTEDTCLSIVLGSNPVIQPLLVNLESQAMSFSFVNQLVGRNSPVAVISSDSGLGIGDTHQLVSPLTSRHTDETLEALEIYRATRDSDNGVPQETLDTLDRNITCTFQFYIGLDEHERPSSVRGMFDATASLPKNIAQSMRDELDGDPMGPAEKYIAAQQMREFTLSRAKAEKVRSKERQYGDIVSKTSNSIG